MNTGTYISLVITIELQKRFLLWGKLFETVFSLAQVLPKIIMEVGHIPLPDVQTSLIKLSCHPSSYTVIGLWLLGQRNIPFIPTVFPHTATGETFVVIIMKLFRLIINGQDSPSCQHPSTWKKCLSNVLPLEVAVSATLFHGQTIHLKL